MAPFLLSCAFNGGIALCAVVCVLATEGVRGVLERPIGETLGMGLLMFYGAWAGCLLLVD